MAKQREEIKRTINYFFNQGKGWFGTVKLPSEFSIEFSFLQGKSPRPSDEVLIQAIKNELFEDEQGIEISIQWQDGYTFRAVSGSQWAEYYATKINGNNAW